MLIDAARVIESTIDHLDARGPTWLLPFWKTDSPHEVVETLIVSKPVPCGLHVQEQDRELFRGKGALQ